jgi:cyanate permease
MGFAGASLSGVLSASLLGRWFPARRLGVALAVAWSASGVGAMVIFPLAQHLIATDGWRHAYIVFAIISAAFIPLLLVLPWRRIERGAPGLAKLRAAADRGPTVSEAVRDWPFWALTLSFGLTSLGIFSIVPQAMVYLLERGLDGAYAARALAVAGFLTPLGMIGFSWLADRGGNVWPRFWPMPARSWASARSPWCADPATTFGCGCMCCCSAAAWARAAR